MAHGKTSSFASPSHSRERQNLDFSKKDFGLKIAGVNGWKREPFGEASSKLAAAFNRVP
jgi:hypothetical protein